MGNIRDKLSLVFFECVQFIRHIIHGVGKVSQFIVPVDLCARFKISFGITLGDDCQPVQWTVKSMCKQQKEEQCCQKNKFNGIKNNVHKTVCILCDGGHGLMDHDITVNPVIAGDRRKYRKVFFGKRSVKVTGHIITVAKVGSVETFERFIIGICCIFADGFIGRIKKNISLIVHDPDLGRKIFAKTLHLFLKILQRKTVFIIIVSITRCNLYRFPV